MIFITKNHYTKPLCILLLFCFMRVATLNAMQGQESSNSSTQPQPLSVTYRSAYAAGNIALKVGSYTKHLIFNHPVLSTGAIGLATIVAYETVPQVQAPLQTMATWTSKTLYNAYHTVTYKIYVAPIIAQIKAAENNIKAIEHNISELQEQQNILNQTKEDIHTKISLTHNEIRNIMVTPHEMNSVAEISQKIADQTKRFRKIARADFIRNITSLNNNSIFFQTQAQCLQRMSAQLTIPVQIIIPKNPQSSVDYSDEIKHVEQCSHKTKQITQTTDAILNIVLKIKKDLANTTTE